MIDVLFQRGMTVFHSFDLDGNDEGVVLSESELTGFQSFDLDGVDGGVALLQIELLGFLPFDLDGCDAQPVVALSGRFWSRNALMRLRPRFQRHAPGWCS
ncbi:MAG: hypothetical protein IIB54_15475 [Planctomycetes bacterium]|nr:hypothetical protein [Planctomycetota bacterium]